MKRIMAVLAAAAMLTLAPAGHEGRAGQLGGSVSTNGSTSMERVVGILSEQFMADHRGVTVTYDATGSGSGIEAAASGACDIGLASRGLKEAEAARGLAAITVARDGIAIIVGGNSPVRDLSAEQIAAVFTGRITSWSALGGSGDIACIGREAGSGTRDGFESITKTAGRCRLAQELTSTGAVVAAVQGNPNAIGYASFASVAGRRGIRVLTVSGAACTAENILNGSYPIQRPFNLVVRSDRKLGDAARAFLDYVTSRAAADLITRAGAVPTAKRP